MQREKVEDTQGEKREEMGEESLALWKRGKVEKVESEVKDFGFR